MKTQLGQMLDQFRKECGMTQSEMAKRIGVSQPHLSMIENGQFSVGIKFRDNLFEVFGGELSDVQKSLINREMWKSRTVFEIPDGYDNLKILIGHLIDNKDTVDIVKVWESVQ